MSLVDQMGEPVHGPPHRGGDLGGVRPGEQAFLLRPRHAGRQHRQVLLHQLRRARSGVPRRADRGVEDQLEGVRFLGGVADVGDPLVTQGVPPVGRRRHGRALAVDETFHARHPERSSLTAGLADAYADAAARTGAAVERLTLRELDFDPVLHLGLPHGAGRSARFIMPADSPGFYLALVQGNPTRKQVARSTLTFCGFSPGTCHPVLAGAHGVRHQG